MTRFQVVALVIAFLCWAVGALAMAAPLEGCSRKCKKYENVHVMFTLDMRWADRFLESFAKRHRTHLDEEELYVFRGGFFELRKHLNLLASACKRVKSLVLDDRLLLAPRLEAWGAGDLSCVMAEIAGVAVTDRASTQGCMEEDAVQELGRLLLPRGGEIFTPTPRVVLQDREDDGTRLWRDFRASDPWQTVAVVPGPLIRGVKSFSIPPLTAQECMQPIDDALARLRVVEMVGRNLPTCWTEADQTRLAEIRGKLLAAKGTQATLMGPMNSRAGIDPLHRLAARSYATAFEEYEIAISRWENRDPHDACPGPQRERQILLRLNPQATPGR